MEFYQADSEKKIRNSDIMSEKLKVLLYNILRLKYQD